MTLADVLLPLGLGLGEGATALDDSQFLFVDIHQGRIWRGNTGGTAEVLATLEHSVGAVAATSDGGVLWSGGTAIGMIGSDTCVDLPDPVPGVRMNDGKADPRGRFVAGTMTEPVVDGAGSLWSFTDGAATLLVDGVTISNGLCWSATGNTLFYVDTPTQRVDAFDYDLDTGVASDRRSVVEIPMDAGAPDGMTIDHEGGLWVALWGGSAVNRYVDGHLDHVVDLPTPFVTSATFVERTLVITTAAEPSSEDPAAGHIFAAEVDLTGPLPHLADRRTAFGHSSSEPVPRDRCR